MFGYLVANVDDLATDEKERYRSLYCGLCREMGERCGQRCRPSITYDMAFLIMLLGSLYEPQETESSSRCVAHPLSVHDFAQNEFTAYAADLTVALAYHKCWDNWRDDHSVSSRAYAAALAAPYRAVKERLPRQCAAMERELAAISALEADPAAAPDEAAKRFGALMGELFAVRDDCWAESLGRLGAELGRFIYVMDAVCDFREDAKKGSYNPLNTLGCEPEDMKPVLASLAGQAAEAFERLPLERDEHILRSVIYAGIWQKYRAQFEKEKTGGHAVSDEERGGREASPTGECEGNEQEREARHG